MNHLQIKILDYDFDNCVFQITLVNFKALVAVQRFLDFYPILTKH